MNERIEFVGASEIAAIFGMNVHEPAFEVWARKTGRSKGKEETRDMRRGTKVEPLVREELPERDDVKSVIDPADIPQGMLTRFDDGQGRVRAHPDGLIHMVRPDMNLEGPGVLEIKVPRKPTFDRIKEQGLPAENILQVQTGIELSGLGWGCFAIHCADDWETLVFPMERRDDLALVEKGTDWYNRYVLTDTPPPALPPVDIPPIKPIGGELVYVSPDNDRWVDLMERYGQYRETKKLLQIIWEGTDEESSLKAELIDFMENVVESAVAEGAGWKIRLNQEYSSRNFNQQKLAELGPFDPQLVHDILVDEGIPGPHVQQIMARFGLTARIDPYDKDRFYTSTTPVKVIMGWESKLDE